MKTIGIIAEYNSFHNGHAYQIQKIRELTNADYIVVAMSGDFVQRGAPAILDKYTRTQTALSCGADLVVELPALWAVSSAESFAMAGITLLERMGCVEGICFGAETDCLPALSAIADVLADEPQTYRNALSRSLKQGLTFPKARLAALTETETCALSRKDLAQILEQPNNILAIEYLKALKRRESRLIPLLLKREGAGYHDAALTGKTALKTDMPAARDCTVHTEPVCASATAVRNLLLADGSFTSHTRELKQAMPAEAFSVLDNYLHRFPPLDTDDFSALLNYRLLLEASNGLERFWDVSRDISNRLLKNRYDFLSFSQFCELNKSRDITYTRMSRILLHILLGLTDEDAARGKRLDYIPYLRLLGFRKSSSALLSGLKCHADIPLISKLADADGLLDNEALFLLHRDIMAAELYEQVLAHKTGAVMRSEYTREIVVL